MSKNPAMDMATARFEFIRTEDNVALLEGKFRGQTCGIVCAVYADGEDYRFSPLFVELTEAMAKDLTDFQGTPLVETPFSEDVAMGKLQPMTHEELEAYIENMPKRQKLDS